MTIVRTYSTGKMFRLNDTHCSQDRVATDLHLLASRGRSKERAVGREGQLGYTVSHLTAQRAHRGEYVAAASGSCRTGTSLVTSAV